MSTVVVPDIEELSVAEAREKFGARVSDRLGIPVQVFLDRLDAGEYQGTEDSEVLRMITLVPFLR